ncbi:membrane-bound O-acyltransferase family protein, partial [Arcobacter venerupis]
IGFGGLVENIQGNNFTPIWLIFGFILILFFENSMEKGKEFKINYKTLILTFICLTAGLLSLNKVSEFLYFNF